MTPTVHSLFQPIDESEDETEADDSKDDANNVLFIPATTQIMRINFIRCSRKLTYEEITTR